jgi:hypothetical protein
MMQKKDYLYTEGDINTGENRELWCEALSETKRLLGSG